jgi:hypothetical protein
MEDLEKCNKCHRDFPEELIQPMYVNGKAELICPLCALEIRNKAHGLPINTLFQGEQAQEFYNEALAWLGRKK